MADNFKTGTNETIASKGIPYLGSGPEDNLVYTDTFKNPVKISDTYFDGSDKEVNTLWAEKADYIYEKNVGEGLRNIPYVRKDSGDIAIVEGEDGINYADLSYKLELQPAKENELGGVKLSGMFKPDKDGNPTINRSEFLATETVDGIVGRPGFVAPDGSFTVNSDGELGLKPAKSNKLGGVIVKDYENLITPGGSENIKTGLKMIGVNNDVISVYTDYVSKNIPKVIKDKFDNPLFDTNKKQLSEKSLDGSFALLLELDKIRRKEYETVKTTVDYGMETHINNQSLIFGSDTFDAEGCTIRFEKDFGNTEYSVVAKQTSITLGDVGEISVVKFTDRCIVYNTGRNAWDTFNYIIVPKEVEYVDPTNFNVVDFDPEVVNNLPIAHGSEFFVSGEGSVQIDVPFSTANFSVIVTPTAQLNNAGEVGDFWVEKYTNKDEDGRVISHGFVVKCTASDLLGENKVPFDWIAVEYKEPKKDNLTGLLKVDDYQYDRLAFPVRAGKCLSKKIEEEVDGKTVLNVVASVDFAENLFYNRRYFVFPQLTSDNGGSIGEYSSVLRKKDRNGFEFDISGNAENYTMDWITIDNVPFPTFEDLHEIEKQLHERDEKLLVQEERITKLEENLMELYTRLQAIEGTDRN